MHTIHNKIYEFNSEIRIARNYNRFKGLMAKLLIDGSIETENAMLINQFNGDINQLIDNFKDPKLIILTSKGRLINGFEDLFVGGIDKDIIVFIGGFQKSNFSKDIYSISNNLISISQYPLDAWIATNRIITYFELKYRIF
jgi:rRNA small subunit pseudouridine methyltransferase Nep1